MSNSDEDGGQGIVILDGTQFDDDFLGQIADSEPIVSTPIAIKLSAERQDHTEYFPIEDNSSNCIGYSGHKHKKENTVRRPPHEVVFSHRNRFRHRR